MTADPGAESERRARVPVITDGPVASSRGLFITFEGPEGGGKSTQIRLLADRLRSEGLSVATTREPGGTGSGERIREILLEQSEESLLPETEAFLVLAARSEHVAKFILPLLEAGSVVICDRYADATRAYQGYGGGLPIALLDSMIEIATGGLQPDLTLLLDLPVEVGLSRRRDNAEEWTRFDAASVQFHRRVRDGYLTMAEEDEGRWVVIDASSDESEVHEEVWQAVAPLLAGTPDPRGTPKV